MQLGREIPALTIRFRFATPIPHLLGAPKTLPRIPSALGRKALDSISPHLFNLISRAYFCLSEYHYYSIARRDLANYTVRFMTRFLYHQHVVMQYGSA